MTSLRPAILLTASLISLHVPAGQQPQPGDLPRFKVSVDAVRIDAVVTDTDGRVVKDLTAEDFVVLQNGRPQKVTFAQFVPVTSASDPAAAWQQPGPAALTTTSIVRSSAIQRTLAIVVDDLGLSVESLYYAKRALRTFVDREVLPTDLVGILRTGGSTGALQPFTTDRRILHTTIDTLRWNGFSRSGVEPFDAINSWTTFDDRTGLSDPDDFSTVNVLRRSIMASGTLGALNLAIRAARDLPGRKALLFVSEGFELFDRLEPDTRVRAAVDRVIDQATRAGVVIYSLDPRGLQSAGLQASDNLARPMPGQTMAETAADAARDRLRFNRDTQEALGYVAEQTGGFAVLNTNDLARGLARISEDVRDYYLIGYVPEQGTFAGKDQKPSVHNIAVTVRRPGLRVRTRKQFLGVTDVDEAPAPLTPAQDLIRAAISPFTSTDIGLLATPLPGYAPERGLFVRTLLHIDARALTFADGGNGKKTAAADVLGMVFDADGTEVAHLSTGFEIALTEQASEDALQRGLAYKLLVPIPKAGGYQLRFSVRDRQSGRLGSAGEFVELPDVERGAFALSGIVLRDAADAGQADAAGVSAEQAVRAYRTGTPLAYAFDVYNAAREVHAGIAIWRGNQKVATIPVRRLTVPKGSERRVSVAGGFRLGDSLPAGGYVLEVSAATADAKGTGRVRTAVQRLPFDVKPTASAPEPPSDRVSRFPLSQVRLLDGPFERAQRLDVAYLTALDPDKLLAPFRTEAGLEPKAEKYPNWEGTGLGGHTAGHYLTALAQASAASGDPALRRRLDYMVEELAACQRANADGYVGGVPRSRELWRDVGAGRLRAEPFSLNGTWVPWYNLHKLFAGLRDAHAVGGNAQARDVLVKLADWAGALVGNLSDAQLQEMLRTEHGGMNEVLADVYAITSDAKHLRAAQRFSHRALLEPLARREDPLTGLHANTQIPKAIGYARIAALGGEPAWRDAAAFFWERVVARRTVAFGGNSVREHFNPPDTFSEMIESREGPETCNTYNMLRLTEQLFEGDPAARYADFYERALFNHILSAQHPEHGGFVYFTPIRPRHYRVYSQPAQTFWCCVGSGMESHSKHGQFVYARSGDDLYVNLFIASTLDWPDPRIRLRQETRFPDEDRTRLLFSMPRPARFTLHVRHPGWVAEGAFSIRVNGRPWTTASKPSSYAAIAREWREGDRVEIELPMRTALERLPDGSDYAAIVHGPIVLAARTGSEDVAPLVAGDGRMAHIPSGPTLPLGEAPVLVGTLETIARSIRPVPGRPLTFTAREVLQPASARDLELVPFWRVHDARYMLYWRVVPPEK